jgi:predicted dehydrogenase
MKKSNRRNFIRKVGMTTAFSTLIPKLSEAGITYLKPTNSPGPVSANDKIRIALIGTGGMGIGDAQTALGIEGVEIVAACDLYQGRLKRAKELWGNQIFTTRDYREILDRKDVDVVINATIDHWHSQISVDALKAGKHIYCEKPMVKHIEEGHKVIEAQKQYKKVFQVGSQFVSSIIHAKAKELIKAGEIGEVNFAEAQIDRHSAIGAWQYTIPPDANTQTVDWDTYLKDTPKRPFDAARFFRWRNYQDYGTGVAGDLYVHMLSMLHFVLDSHGPTRVMSTGGLRHWHDGRDVPDIHIGLFDYPDSPAHKAFNLTLRTNFVSGGGDNYLFRIVGSEGDISIGWDNLVLRKTPFPDAPGLSIGSFDSETQEKIKTSYQQQYPEKFRMQEPSESVFKTPKDYKGDRHEHFKNFFHAIRNNTPVVEDAVFGLRACGPTVAGNISYFEKRIVEWDPERMILKN